MEKIEKTKQYRQEPLKFEGAEDVSQFPTEKPYTEYTEEEKRIIRESIFAKRRQNTNGTKIEYTSQEGRYIREEEEDSREGEHPWYR